MWVAALVLFLVVVLFSVGFYFLSVEGCHAPTIAKLKNKGLDGRYRFKSKLYRLLAENIYQYRRKTFVSDAVAGVVSIIIANSLTTNAIVTPPEPSALSDVALHKLATEPLDRFSKLIYYIPMFNHSRYAECMQAYDSKTNTFKDDKRSVVLNDIFNLAVLKELTNPDSVVEYTKLTQSIVNVAELTNLSFMDGHKKQKKRMSMSFSVPL